MYRWSIALSGKLSPKLGTHGRPDFVSHIGDVEFNPPSGPLPDDGEDDDRGQMMLGRGCIHFSSCRLMGVLYWVINLSFCMP